LFYLGDTSVSEEKEKARASPARKPVVSEEKAASQEKNAAKDDASLKAEKKPSETKSKPVGRPAGRKSVAAKEEATKPETAAADKSAAAPAAPVLERRAARAIAEDSLKYSIDSITKCPFPGCDSKGNLHSAYELCLFLTFVWFDSVYEIFF
jgi:hypothetical protein